jgi:hypothetical protein
MTQMSVESTIFAEDFNADGLPSEPGNIQFSGGAVQSNDIF